MVKTTPMPPKPRPTLGAHDIRRVAVEAVADERTVRAFLRNPRLVRSTSAARIAAALLALGLTREDQGRNNE